MPYNNPAEVHMAASLRHRRALKRREGKKCVLNHLARKARGLELELASTSSQTTFLIPTPACFCSSCLGLHVLLSLVIVKKLIIISTTRIVAMIVAHCSLSTHLCSVVQGTLILSHSPAYFIECSQLHFGWALLFPHCR